MQLSAHVGVPVPASAILCEAVQFALSVAEDTDGAFDPTVGRRMEARGFNREHRTGQTVRSPFPHDDDVTYRDVHVDPDRRTITLGRPLTLDLGAVAKGLAVDAAARELQPFRDFAIDAGGDLYLGGRNPDGVPWSVGIRHPRLDGQLIDSLRVSDKAVCTSGDYERPAPDDIDEHHVLDPRSGVRRSRRKRDGRRSERDARGCAGNRRVRAGPGRGHQAVRAPWGPGPDRDAGARALRDAGAAGE